MARIIDTADVDFASIPNADDQHWVYNGLDCCVTREIFDSLRPQLDATAAQVYDLSRALQAPVLEMSMRGIAVNKARRIKTLQDMRRKLSLLEENLTEIIRDGIGIDLNWRSPAQLNELFYDIMGLPVQKKRNTNGAYTRTSDRTAVENLSQYYIAEPICNHLLALRDLGKSIGFLETGVDPDGRMRSSFNIAGTNTFRFASSASDFGTGTNLQNVNGALRSVFVADRGMKFANLDLEQADSRNVGAACWNAFVESRGEAYAGSYLDACEIGDLHTFVCKMANPGLPWGESPDKVVAKTIAYRDKTYRDLSKGLGHGSNYLGTPPTMAKQSKIPVKMAAEFQKKYFETFPVIPAWHQLSFDQLAANSMLHNVFGFRRYFWDRPTASNTRREAIAFIGQSSTATQMNKGLLKLWQGHRVQLLIQVHDSILFQYPERLEDEIVPWALETLRVPLQLARGRDFVVPTEAMTGWNWGYHSDDNPDGLKKWAGGDSRKRQELTSALSILQF